MKKDWSQILEEQKASGENVSRFCISEKQHNTPLNYLNNVNVPL